MIIYLKELCLETLHNYKKKNSLIIYQIIVILLNKIKSEETIFITHSLGGIFVIKFLIDNKVKIKRIITVAGFNNTKFGEDNSLYDSFYIEDKKLKDLTKYCVEKICIYSDNDPYVSISDAESFSKNTEAEKVLIHNAGHFNEKFGYKEFKEILEYISL